MSNILQHNIERFGMVTVMDVVLYEVDSTNPVLQLDTLKMTNISVEGSAKEIRGGIGNDMLINYDFGRTANIEMQDALISPASLSFLWGLGLDEIGDVSNQVYDVVETYTSSPTGTLTFDQTLESENPVVEVSGPNKVYVLSTDGKEGKHWGTLAKSGDTVTITWVGSDDEDETGFANNKAYKVFIQRTAPEGRTITLKNDNFPSAVKMVGTTFVIDERTGKKKLLQIEIPKLKINSNFSFTMDAEGDASVFDFSGVALSAGGELIKLRYLGDY